MGPIAHGEPSASQAAELRSCYLCSLDLLLEHQLRSVVRGPGRPGAGATTSREEAGAEVGWGAAGQKVMLYPSPLPSTPAQAFPCISTGVFGERGQERKGGVGGGRAQALAGAGRAGRCCGAAWRVAEPRGAGQSRDSLSPGPQATPTRRQPR